MQPICLTENQMNAVLAAATPLPPNRRSDFLVDIARELSSLPEVGDGVLHRVIMVAQKRYFAPPIVDHHGHHKHVGKYA
jgi:hypothetical protein